MSPGRPPRRAPVSKFTPRKKKKSKPTWMAWLPLVIGIAITPLARRSADVLAMEGPRALQLLYPWVALVRLHGLGLSESTANTLAQAAMYLQFPVYGLFMSLLMRRQGFVRPLIWTMLLHIVPLLILTTLSHS